MKSSELPKPQKALTLENYQLHGITHYTCVIAKYSTMHACVYNIKLLLHTVCILIFLHVLPCAII